LTVAGPAWAACARWPRATRRAAASYAALQTTSHNIANTHNAFLTRQASTAKSISSLDSTRLAQLRQLETIFKTGEQGLGNATSEFLNAMSDLASRPADGATRAVVLARADELATRFAQAGAQFDTIQQSVTAELKASVDSVNQLASQIAQANGAIASARGLGQPPNDLLDQRDMLISQLSQHLQISTISAEDGTVGVFIGGGQRLVLGDAAERLEVMPDAYDGSRSSVGISEGKSATRRLAETSLGAGGIAGLLRFQNRDLVAAQTQIGQLSAAIAQAVNDQQMLGLNLHEPVGSVPSSALFGLEDSTREKVYPANTNLRTPSGQSSTP
jgi:flagellar hook-associated protein 1 FlgK